MEFRGLSDERFAEALYDHLRNDGRIELEELDIVCREGTVFLEGALPSERSRAILIDVLENVLGLPLVVDHINIDPLLWERRDRTPLGERETGKTEQEVLLHGEDIGGEVVESETEGSPISPPDRFVPEREEE